MNGFTNAILSLLLSWIRLLVNQLWKLISSEDGASFFSFLADRWMVLLLILCVGGFIVDRIVYLFRWRPYYLWRGRRRRARPYDGGSETEAPYSDVADGGENQAFPTEEPGMAYRRPENTLPPIEQPAEATSRYAPSFQRDASSFAARSVPYVPPADLSPVFDDDPDWNGSDLSQPSRSMAEVMADVKADFGAARPEPAAYIRDMQAGFARPLPPEQLYAAKTPAPAPEARPVPPVHPGLDGERIRENVGLSPAGSLSEGEPVPAAASFRSFAPFNPPEAEQTAQSRARNNPLAALAKKARGFVGVGDEDDPRTIHDLQSTVDMRKAFHEPVYPRPKPVKEDDDLSTY